MQDAKQPFLTLTVSGAEDIRVQSFLDTSPDAIIQMDDQGTITGWNQQAELCFGWLRMEVIGRPVQEIIVPQRHHDLHLHSVAYCRQIGENSLQMETEALHRDGHEFPIELTLSAVKTQAGFQFSAFIRDLSEQRAPANPQRDTLD
jgi:PAS domain S-box-containing protein